MTLTSKSLITSERASIYLQQLCKHFGHKTEVTFTPQDGEIAFPFGHCKLTATGDLLTMIVSADDEESLKRTEQVVGSHLERFAFKEQPQIHWN